MKDAPKPPMQHVLSLNYPETCGMKELPEDTFADVRRALDKWLLENDPDYRRSSDTARARSLATIERKKREKEENRSICLRDTENADIVSA